MHLTVITNKDMLWGWSNASCIIENMALAATDLGVGSCHIWGAAVASSGNQELVASLQLPEGFVPFAGLVVGKTNVEIAPRPKDTHVIATSYLA